MINLGLVGTGWWGPQVIRTAGGAAYPAPLDQMVVNVADFEAIVASLAAGGAPVAVQNG